MPYSVAITIMMLIHEGHVFEAQIETKFEVCDPCSVFLTQFFNATTLVMLQQ